LAVVLGLVVGSVVNMALVGMGPLIVPLPQGADVSTTERLRESIKMFGPANFLFPFLAHALGTLTGAFVAAKLAASHSMRFAMAIGAVFLLGGAAAASMIGGPAWFNACDIVLAYIPMGYAGGLLARRSKPNTE
jgi:hypothetical protein